MSKAVTTEVKYLTAGKAVFTLNKPCNGRRYTYKVTQDKNNPRRFFVNVLFGPEKDYRYIGLFYDDTFKLRTTNASSVPHAHPAVDLIEEYLDRVSGRDMHLNLEVYKSQRCARCGRLLTTPDSIQIGLGPECSNHA